MKKTLAAIAAIALLGMAPVCAFAEEEAAPVAEAAMDAPLAEDAPAEEPAETESAEAPAETTTAPAETTIPAETTAAAQPGRTEERTCKLGDTDNAAEVTVSLDTRPGLYSLYLTVAINGKDTDAPKIEVPVEFEGFINAHALDDYFKVTGENQFRIRSYATSGVDYSEMEYRWTGSELVEVQEAPGETTAPAQTGPAQTGPASTGTTTGSAGTNAPSASTTTATATDKKDDGKKDEDSESPKTGDTTSALPLILGAAAALTGAATIVRRKQD